MVKKFLKLGTSSIVGTIAVGAIPDVTGTASEATLKTSFATGMSNVGKTFPAHGSLAGAGMVLKSTRRLRKRRGLL